MKKLAVFADGLSCDTLKAILKACQDGAIDGEVALIVSSRKDQERTPYKIAMDYGINSFHLKYDRVGENWHVDSVSCQELRDLLGRAKGLGIDLIVLAGFNKWCPDYGPSMNSHPTENIEEWGGAGWHGTIVTEAEIKAGLKFVGSTIHWVAAKIDGGNVIAKTGPETAVLTDDTPEMLLNRKKIPEITLYVKCIAAFCRGELHPGESLL